MWHRIDIFQWLKVEKMKFEAIKILYAHTLFHFIPIWTNLNETHLPYSCGIEMIFFNVEKLKKWNLRLLKSSMRIYAHTLFHFIPIWTNLNKTQFPYSFGIENIFFNNEKLKKLNQRLLKSSVRIYAHSLFHFSPIWNGINNAHRCA